MLNETDDGRRVLEEAVRIWNDGRREPEWLGRPEYDHRLTPGTRMIERSTLAFPDAPGGGFSVTATPLLTAFIAIGTGYGMCRQWAELHERHLCGQSPGRAAVDEHHLVPGAGGLSERAKKVAVECGVAGGGGGNARSWTGRRDDRLQYP